MENQNSKTIKKVCSIAVFAALAYVTACLCSLLPKVGGFLSLDAKDAVIVIASFIYGPIAAPILSLIVAFLEFITISTTGVWGFIMNFTASFVFSFVASIIYKYKKTYIGVIIGLFSAIVLTVTVMLGLNPLIIPLFPGANIPRAVVIDLIPTMLFPFNLAKTMMNGALALMLYKPIISALRKSKLLPAAEYKTTFNKKSVITLIVGGVSLICALGIVLYLSLK